MIELCMLKSQNIAVWNMNFTWDIICMVTVLNGYEFTSWNKWSLALQTSILKTDKKYFLTTCFWKQNFDTAKIYKLKLVSDKMVFVEIRCIKHEWKGKVKKYYTLNFSQLIDNKWTKLLDILQFYEVARVRLTL